MDMTNVQDIRHCILTYINENVECVKELDHDSRRITTHAIASLNCNTSYLLTYEDGTVCSKMLAYKLQTPVNNPEESIWHSVHGESLKSRIANMLRISLQSHGQKKNHVNMCHDF
jgi:hypothetical protein